MKKSTKLIKILMMVILAGIVLAGSFALADDRIYTSEPFKIPLERVHFPEPEAEEPAEGEATLIEGEESEEPTEATEVPAEGTEAPVEATEVPAEGTGEPAEATEVPAVTEAPVEATEAPAKVTGQPAEATEAPAEEPAEATEQPAEATEASEPQAPERQVIIYSNRKEVVTEGDIIELTSELIGFDGVEVTYQWQMLRDEEEGWINVEGANRWKYAFIATRETVQYSWRLIVNVVE